MVLDANGRPHSGRPLNPRVCTDCKGCLQEDSYSVGSSPDTFVPVVSWGVAAAQGQRRTMEDTHIGVSGLEKHVQLSPDSTRARSFFGVSFYRLTDSRNLCLGECFGRLLNGC